MPKFEAANSADLVDRLEAMLAAGDVANLSDQDLEAVVAGKGNAGPAGRGGARRRTRRRVVAADAIAD